MSLPIPEPPRLPRPLRIVGWFLLAGAVFIAVGAVAFDRDLWGQPTEQGVVTSYQEFGDGFAQVGCAEGVRRYVVTIADPRPGLSREAEYSGCRGVFEMEQEVTVRRSADGEHVQLDPPGLGRYALASAVLAGLGLLVLLRHTLLVWVVRRVVRLMRRD